MHPEWRNWSGSLCFTPQQQIFPESETEIVSLVKNTAQNGKKIRVVGAGHSSTPLVQTDETLLSLRNLQGLVSYDKAKNEATIKAGMLVKEAGQALQEIGLAMHNTGDVDVQMVAGAIGTGTHGTGHKLQSLSSMLIGARLVTASGEIIEKQLEDDPDFFQALQVSLGTLGIFTQLRLKLLPAFKLHRREWFTHIDNCLYHLDELVQQNRNFDFYWYPRNDMAKIRIMNPPGEGMQHIPYAKLDKEMEGWSAEILPRFRNLLFDEIEYAVPAEAGPECFKEIRQRVKQEHRKEVGWRLLYRTIAADNAYLSPCYGRDSVTISLHHHAGLPFWEYFNDIEPILKAYNGRPHWGKKHNFTGQDSQKLYPMLSRFLEIRKQLDPDGLFLNDYLKQLLGIC